MSEKRVTVSLVWVRQDTRPEGLMVGKVTYFRLPGADYNQICAALLAAKFEELDTGDMRVTVSLVWVRQDTREEGITVQEGTDFRLPGADYSQTCAALLAAKFELVHRVAASRLIPEDNHTLDSATFQARVDDVQNDRLGEWLPLVVGRAATHRASPSCGRESPRARGATEGQAGPMA